MVLVLTHAPVDRSLPWEETGPFAATDPNPPWSASHPHMGTDLAFDGCEGADAYAMADGVVVPFLNDGSFGNGVCLELTQTNGSQYRYLLYAHLRDRVVNIGDRVKGGQLIGHVGHTSTDNIGAHLHRQLCVSNQFPRVLAMNADPDLFLALEDPPMTPDEKRRFERLERLSGGYGIDVTAEDAKGNPVTIRLTGEEALAFLDQQRNNSLPLAIDRQNTSINALRGDVAGRFQQVSNTFILADVSNPPTTDQLLDKLIDAGHILGDPLTDPFEAKP